MTAFRKSTTMMSRAATSSNKNKTILSRLTKVWNTFFSNKESPRNIQERNDLYKIALAVTFHDVRRLKNATTSNENRNDVDITAGEDDMSSSRSKGTENGTATDIPIVNDNSPPSTNNLITSQEELEAIFDEAHDILEQKKVYDMSIRGLRLETQQLLRPQVSSLLQVFQNTETMVPSTTRLDSEESEEFFMMREANKKRCCDVLYEEQCQTLDLLGDNANHTELEVEGRKVKKNPFLNKKLSAIQTIASFYEWEHFYFDKSFENIGDGSDISNNNNDSNAAGADEFGYIQSTDEQVNSSIRYYQMINLSRSALIRQQIGYSVISLKSTLPNAGRGIFVDGTAPAGSILAFFPGDVWPKEYLVNSKAIAPYFKKDPRYLLSIRYDDILIDSRKAPYTVLDDDHSNAFAVAHIVNHPSKVEEPNCSTMAIDFMENMKLNETNIDIFVPNKYKKKPMMFGPQAMNHDAVMMHSMGLLSSRDITNEELFYDYNNFLTLGLYSFVRIWV